MQFLIGLALVLAVSAAPFTQCPQTNITITTPQWLMPPTLARANSYCTYMFTFPSDSYAVFALSVTGASQTDQITVNNMFNDQYMMDNRHCDTGCDTFNLITSWPGSFYLTYYTGPTTTMKMQMSVTIKKLNVNGNIVSNTLVYKNGPSSLLYLSDFQQGASYVITSNSSKVDLKLPVQYFSSIGDESLLNGVFIYDGGKSLGTLKGLMGNGFASQSNTITLYCVNSVNLKGAVMATDMSNLGTLNFDVEYATVFPPSQTGYISLNGYIYPQNKEGGAVLLTDENEKTAITVRQLIPQDDGEYYYQYGGPTAGHNATVFPISNKDLPKTLNPGQMVTFYISRGTGNIQYSLSN